ncbi:hypothetical protein QQZ08_011547 [Neonectria magnoliae]|uniref:MYB DNA-binding domain-containing protein n=1 Tax=Neonectria magnoliae TaxID=2732573 RepID=A0ABR1H980_9HYPO
MSEYYYVTATVVHRYTALFNDAGLLEASPKPDVDRTPEPVAELAQLKSETPLCLLRAEYPTTVDFQSRLDLVRAPRSYANGPRVGRSGIPAVTVDIAALLKGPDSDESSVSPPRQAQSAPAPRPPSIKASTAPARPGAHVAPPVIQASMPAGRRNMPPHASDQPVKKQSKWSPEEDALIIELRGSGMKWEDISKRLPGRSAISCRLHYQNYLERRSEWDEERKNKLARLYERFKPEMWAKVAEEMAVPWRAAEAMHWQLGEADMARRAGVIPFSLAAVNVDSNITSHRNSPSRSHAHSHSQGSLPRDLRAPSPRAIYNRPQPMAGVPSGRTIVSRRESIHPPPMPMAADPNEIHYVPGPGLAPIQNQPPPRGGGLLPGVAELTTGVSPYSTPAGAASVPMTAPPSQTPLLPALGGYSMETTGSKRRASPDHLQRESSHRRRMA